MAHGTSRINICYDCNQYTLVSRFSADPICPNCGKISEQTNKNKIREKYSIGFFYDWKLNFDHWEQILELQKEQLVKRNFSIDDLRKAYDMGRTDARISEREGRYYDTFNEWFS